MTLDPHKTTHIQLTRGPWHLTLYLTTTVGMAVGSLHEWSTIPILKLMKLMDWMTPKDTTASTGSNTPLHQRCPTCILLVPRVQISLRFTLRPVVFELQTILRQVHWNTNMRGQRYPIYPYLNKYPRVPYFNPFHSTTGRFRVTWHFQKRAPNDLWPTRGQRYPVAIYMHVLLVPPYQKYNSLLLYYVHGQPPLSSYMLFETSALNGPKWSWTLQGHRYPIYVLLIHLSPKFHPLSLSTGNNLHCQDICYISVFFILFVNFKFSNAKYRENVIYVWTGAGNTYTKFGWKEKKHT